MKWEIFYFRPDNKNNEEAQFEENAKSVIFTILQWLAVLVFVFGSWFTVAEGERALLTTFGKASNHIYEAGLHLKLPLIQDVKTFDVKTIRADFKTSTYTKDIQTANITVSYSYNLIIFI